MRKLTFGVLVIVIGIFAALPFRRYQSIPDASIIPNEATGPTQSALHGTSMEMLVNNEPRVVNNLQSLALTPRPSIDLPSDHNRALGIPPSYSQIAVPLEQTAANEDDFNAIAAVKKRVRPERFMVPSSTKPEFEAFSVNTPDVMKSQGVTNNPKQSFGSAFARAKAARDAMSNHTKATDHSKMPHHASSETNAQLASSSSFNGTEQLEQLPAAEEDAQRTRHWIRQP